jgi:Homeodomain-like domain
VLSVEDWAEIRRLHRAEGLPIKVIARTLGVSRNTVRSALASDGPPRYERPAKGSVADAFEPRIRELLRAYPTMPATVIGERIGWPHSVRTLSGRQARRAARSVGVIRSFRNSMMRRSSGGRLSETNIRRIRPERRFCSTSSQNCSWSRSSPRAS